MKKTLSGKRYANENLTAGRVFMKSKNRFFEKIAQLNDELGKKGRLLASVYKISKLLDHPANHDKILQAILNESQKIFGFSRGVILLINKAENRLEGKYCIGMTTVEEKRAFAHPLSLKTQICRETIAANTGKINYARDLKSDPSFTEFDRKMEKIWRRKSAISVPLKINREVIGVIEGDSIEQELILSPSDIRLFTAFANQASIILENARLYEQLLEERNIAKSILENAPSGILAVDEYRKVKSINRKAEEILKVRRRKILGKPIAESLWENIAQVLDDTIDNNRTTHRAEIANSKKDGTAEVYEVNSSILKSHAGHVSGAILTIQDLTEIKQTEAMLRRIHTLSSLGQMSANIAHEIRNPLASINFNIQNLSKKLSHDQTLQRTLRNTMEGVERIKLIIKQTLDFSKNTQPAMIRGHIHDILLDSIALIAPHLKEKKIEIRRDLGRNIPDIFFDPHQIQNMLVNLLMNATEAMPRGGVISIRSRIEAPHKGNRLLLTIKDDGIGIPPENLKKIFDPFFTTKQDGTGLGLSIVHKIIEQHNAFIDVRSRENRGTSFFLRFPLAGGC
ncbi:MAG: Sporulation kinase E [Smithella sp. PtaU1.Bin162]|nr:MAG: Sporulation kinase E [Smithella sp. PtaU1.Bin162]